MIVLSTVEETRRAAEEWSLARQREWEVDSWRQTKKVGVFGVRGSEPSRAVPFWLVFGVVDGIYLVFVHACFVLVLCICWCVFCVRFALIYRGVGLHYLCMLIFRCTFWSRCVIKFVCMCTVSIVVCVLPVIMCMFCVRVADCCRIANFFNMYVDL